MERRGPEEATMCVSVGISHGVARRVIMLVCLSDLSELANTNFKPLAR